LIVRTPREIYSSKVGQQITWGAGASYKFTDNFHGIAEMFGRTDGIDLDASPLELNGGVRVRVNKQISILVGGGAGVVKGIGSPGIRAFASVGWAPDYRDSDGDGVTNDNDRCPLVPEDRDDFEDNDGCPDNDNDGDKREDSVDECPNQREDLDGFEDEDGCPEIDNDKDGIPDLDDRCANDAEDGLPPFEKDGCPANKRDSDADGVMDAFDECPEREEDIDEFDDWDGCPDDDNDGDGIPDEEDECPLCPEDMDDFFDGDGCPEADNDQDGVLDADDQCRDEKENVNGVEDFDGCPDDGGAELARLEGDKILFDVPPKFDKYGGLRKQGAVIVDQAAAIMRMHPEVISWTVLVSSKRYYEERAESVKERLIERGIAEDSIKVLSSQSDDDRIGVVVSERIELDPESPEAMCPLRLQVQSRPEPERTEAASMPSDPEATTTDPEPVPEPEPEPPKVVPEELVAFEGVSKTVQFKRNTSVMVGKTKKTLDKIAELLIANPHVVIEIGAHTDGRKGQEKSATITQGQADAAVAYLSEKGVDISQLTAVGHGMDEPVGDNKRSAGRKANRRVELKFTVK
jgi:outer membrane protein OmpA-like peptidoglycan-associated protein